MYLLDTNILSGGAPGPREAPSALIDWMDANSDQYSLGRDTLEVVHKPDEPESLVKFYVSRLGFLDAAPVTDGWITPVPR